jgi:hypothetical protein
LAVVESGADVCLNSLDDAVARRKVGNLQGRVMCPVVELEIILLREEVLDIRMWNLQNLMSEDEAPSVKKVLGSHVGYALKTAGIGISKYRNIKMRTDKAYEGRNVGGASGWDNPPSRVKGAQAGGTAEQRHHGKVDKIRGALDDEVVRPDEEALRDVVPKGGLKREEAVSVMSKDLVSGCGSNGWALVLDNAHGIKASGLDHKGRVRGIKHRREGCEALVDEVEKVGLGATVKGEPGLVKKDDWGLLVLERAESGEEGKEPLKA